MAEKNDDTSKKTDVVLFLNRLDAACAAHAEESSSLIPRGFENLNLTEAVNVLFRGKDNLPIQSMLWNMSWLYQDKKAKNVDPSYLSGYAYFMGTAAPVAAQFGEKLLVNMAESLCHSSDEIKMFISGIDQALQTSVPSDLSCLRENLSGIVSGLATLLEQKGENADDIQEVRCFAGQLFLLEEEVKINKIESGMWPRSDNTGGDSRRPPAHDDDEGLTYG